MGASQYGDPWRSLIHEKDLIEFYCRMEEWKTLPPGSFLLSSEILHWPKLHVKGRNRYKRNTVFKKLIYRFPGRKCPLWSPWLCYFPSPRMHCFTQISPHKLYVQIIYTPHCIPQPQCFIHQHLLLWVSLALVLLNVTPSQPFIK